jgi:transcriptional regulator with GAF, ATPase, and Fis domain
VILRNVEDRLEAERKIRSLTARTEYLEEELAADHGFDDIVGRSPALRAALQSVAQVAETDASVLILGETGTGKDSSREHPRSKPAPQTHDQVNCAAIQALGKQFFGHERGAFTGATQRREGRFALAHRGTIFLDEIGELPLELQGKLLRVLQEGEFEPVGGSRTHTIDVRVLTATNRDLEQAVKQGTFREDLYYRLAVFPLRLPPLRERGDDVTLIANSLIEKLSRGFGKRVTVTPADLQVLRSYSWPGNIRELRNVIEQALITCRMDSSPQRALPGEQPSDAPVPSSGSARSEKS